MGRCKLNQIFIGIGFAFVIIILGLLTANRNMAWQDRISLWSDNAGKSPAKHRVRLNLSAYYFSEKRYALALDEAQQAIISEPDKVTGYINAMSAALKLGAYELAYNYGEVIMDIHPMKVTAQNMEQLALVLGKKEEDKKWAGLAKDLKDVKTLSLND